MTRYTDDVTIIPIAELQRADDRSCVATPAGLGRIDPDFANELHQRAIAEITLVDEVGPGTKATFDRLRGTYVQGLLFYDLYTVVEQLARLLLELALRERFVTFYGRVVVLSRDGVAQEVHADRFDDVRSAMTPRRGKWRVVLKSGDEAPFDPSLHGLLDWARRERLLRGQRNRTRELAFVAMRNIAAHPEGYSLVGPVDALRTLDWLAETVNHLYGHRAPSGGHYPEPIERSPVLVVQGSRGVSFANLTAVGENDWAEMEGQVRIVLLSGGARAADITPSGELCGSWGLPVEQLWGPGDWGDACNWAAEAKPVSDFCDPLDQQFAVRLAEPIDPPVRFRSSMSDNPSDTAGEWLLVRADHPSAVVAHARHVLDGAPECPRSEMTRRCEVEQVARGPWQTIVEVQRDLRP